MKHLIMVFSLFATMNTFAMDWGGITCDELDDKNIQIMKKMMKKSVQFQKQLIENVTAVKKDTIFERPIVDLKGEIESENLEFQRFIAECMIDQPIEKIE